MEADPRDAASVTCLAYSPDGRTLAVGDGPRYPDCMFPPTPCVNENGGLIRLVDAATKRVVMTLGPEKLPGHEYRVDRLDYSPDGRTLVSVGTDRTFVADEVDEIFTLTAWDVATGRRRFSVSQHLETGWSATAASPVGLAIAVAGKKKILRVWYATQAEERFSVKAPGLVGRDEDEHVRELTFSRDGKVLAAGDSNGDVELWETVAGREVAHFRSRERGGLRTGTHGLTFSPDGRTLACLRNGITLYDVVQRREVASVSPGVGECFMGFAFSPDCKAIAIGCDPGAEREDHWSGGWVRLWDLATRRTRDIGKGNVGGPFSLVFSPDGRRLAVASEPYARGGRIALLALDTGKTLAHLSPEIEGRLRLAFAPDGRTLVSTGDNLSIWDLGVLTNIRP